MNDKSASVLHGFDRLGEMLNQQITITRELLREKDAKIAQLEKQLATAQRRRQTKAMFLASREVSR